MDNIAEFKLKAVLPNNSMAFSAGELVTKKEMGKDCEYLWESLMPVFKIPLVIMKSGLYKKSVEEVGDKEICFYSLTLDEKSQKRVLQEAGRIFQYYPRNIGKYSYSRLTFIEVPQFRGMDISSGLVMIGSSYIDALEKGYYDGLQLAIASQWFGSGVFFKFKDKGFWFFQLSLPHYLRLMYIRASRGEEVFNKVFERTLDKYKRVMNTKEDIPISDIEYPDTRTKSKILYGKGPYILDVVRREIGDKNWKRLLRDIYRDFRGKIFTYEDFIKYLSKYDSGGRFVRKLEKMVTQKGLSQ